MKRTGLNVPARPNLLGHRDRDAPQRARRAGTVLLSSFKATPPTGHRAWAPCPSALIRPAAQGESPLKGAPQAGQRGRAGQGWTPDLHEGPMTTDEQHSLYGADLSSWVFCCRCHQAITVEERSSVAFYRLGRGLMHGRCLRPGTAPLVPPKERAPRVAQYAKVHA